MTDIVDDAIRDALELGAEFRLEDSFGPADVPGWDSLGWITIMGLIEERSGMELPLDRLADASSIADLKSIVKDQSP